MSEFSAPVAVPVYAAVQTALHLYTDASVLQLLINWEHFVAFCKSFSFLPWDTSFPWKFHKWLLSWECSPGILYPQKVCGCSLRWSFLVKVISGDTTRTQETSAAFSLFILSFSAASICISQSCLAGAEHNSWCGWKLKLLPSCLLHPAGFLSEGLGALRWNYRAGVRFDL